MTLSRIAGVLASRSDARSLVERALGTLAPGLEWRTELEGLGRATLGWGGEGVSGLVGHGHILVAFDGVLYDAPGLIESRGAAALIAQLAARLGVVDALALLNGDFALAAYDARDDVLWLARDRFGIRPLYHASAGELFGFASRPSALSGLPGVDASPDDGWVARFAASHYRVFDNDPEASPYRAIKQVPAAHALRIGGGGMRLVRYWGLADHSEWSEGEDELAEHYRALLLDAVALRLARTAGHAFMLSGGMDSSSVLAGAVQTLGRPQIAYSVVYDDEAMDESRDVAPMLADHVSDWRPLDVSSPDVLATVERMVSLHDEPIATATWLSHFLLCERAAADGVRTLFGGLGGDELNAGEFEYFPFFFGDLRAAGDEVRLAREVEHWATYHDHPVHRKSAEVAESALARLIDPAVRGHCRVDRERLDRYAAAIGSDAIDVLDFEPALDHPFSSHLKNRTYQDLFRETLPCCLRAQDRHGARFGVVHPLPFLDYRLVEFMFRVPGTLKIRDGVTKVLLRRAMRGLLPEETRTRVKKTGWNAPAHRWFSGSGRDMLLDIVRSQRFRQRGIYDPVEVERLVIEHDEIVRSGRPAQNHMMFLWQLVNLEIWLGQPAGTKWAAQRRSAPAADGMTVSALPGAERSAKGFVQ